jgi:rhodanese-related sulfurtransferase
MKQFAAFIFLIAIFGVGMVSPAPAEEVSPETVAGATSVDANTAKSLFDQGILFVDVRKDSDWDAGRIPGAEHLELKKVYDEASLAELVGKEEAVVIYCNGPKCMRSSEASVMAVSWGFKKVYYFRGGYPEWVAAGLPIE